WFTDLAQAADIHLAEEAAGRWGCGHGDRDRVLLRFPGGPAVAVCSACGKRAGNLHTRLRSRYRGPRERTPVDVEVLRPDGSTLAPGAEELALYRAARAEEATVIASALEQWRRGHTGRHYVLGERDFGEDLEAFLGALGARPWEREALRRAVPEGHVGREATVAAVLAAHPGRFTAALEAVLPGEPGFAARHPGVGPQELLRLAHLETERRKAVADLPAPSGLGPVGAWADRFVRFRRTHNERETLDRLRDDRNALAIPPGHFWAFAQALGGSLVGLERHFDVQAREAGEAWREAARRVLDATGAAYVEALDRYLQETGSGERAEA
ncbi:MAG TPA: hypothetical protein VI796_00015, partial [Candidatus Thermoplasmatota archaeon]|nr:hypothetical protein [Candidatus Thermoplasmatota archaeon]